jgi:hypothetical protein
MGLARRFTVLLAGVLALAALSAASAPAKQRGVYRFKAVETGSSVITTAGPGLFKSTGEAVIEGRLIGKGTLDLELTTTASADGKWKSAGSFKITAENGDILTGTSRGTATVGGRVIPVEFVSKVTGGTGRFANARGRLVSRGTATISSIDPETGTVHTSDEATCKGRIRLAKRHGGRDRD